MGTANIQGDLWGASPQGWAEIQEPQSGPLWEVMLDATAVGMSTRFLDAGCGGGSLSLMAAHRQAVVSGIDAAEGLLAYARQRVPEGDFRHGDIQELPFADNAFDAVIASNSVQYSADRIATLGELKRVCAPTGRVAACLFGPPEKVGYTSIFKALGSAMPGPPKGGGPFELSVPGKLESLFAEAGLTVVESGEVDLHFTYPDFETFWQANVSAGPLQGMMRVLTEDQMREAVRDVMNTFTAHDGKVVIRPNAFTYVIATP